MFSDQRKKNPKQKRRLKPAREDKPMEYISFIAVLFGAAGVVGGIEAENLSGIIAAAVIHVGGIIAMAVAVRKEEPEEEDGGD